MATTNHRPGVTRVWLYHVEALMGFGLGVSPDQRAAETQIDEELLVLVTQLTNEINWYMRERGLTRADLAARERRPSGRRGRPW